VSAPRQVFYKYTSTRVAKTVLTTRRLRWRSPLLFNDPFDVTQELRLNFDERGLSAALTDRVGWLIEHADPGTPIKHLFFGPMMLWAAGQAPDARRRLARGLTQGEGGSTPGQAAALKSLKDTWSAMVPTFRILCLCELNDVAPMWHRYADKFQGVVLEFFAVEAVDSVFQVARPVTYPDARPSPTSVPGSGACSARVRRAGRICSSSTST
jgi:hypothetical protein